MANEVKGKDMGTLAQEQAALQLTMPEQRQTTMDLIRYAVEHEGAIEVIESLQRMHREEEDRKAMILFNSSLAAVQAEAKLIINDSVSNEKFMNGKRYATYNALDKALRPIWTKYGFSLAFGSQPSTVPNQMIVEAYLSLGPHTNTYRLPMDISGDGAKGGGALSKPHAIGAGAEYGRKYLLKMIFNLITGEEEELTTTNREALEILDDIAKCGNIPDLKLIVKTRFDEARKKKDGKLMLLLADANEKRMKELQHAD